MNYIKNWFVEHGFIFYEDKNNSNIKYFEKGNMRFPLQIAEDLGSEDEFEKILWLADNGFKIQVDIKQSCLMLTNDIVVVPFEKLIREDLLTIKKHFEEICKIQNEKVLN